MFTRSLGEIGTFGDEMNVIVRTLLRRLDDHGGTNSHLNDLLDDAKGRHHPIIDMLAKKLVGPIWDYVDQEFDLGIINFELSVQEFDADYQSLGLAQKSWRQFDPDEPSYSRTRHWGYTESKPNRPCRYKLWHSPKALSFQEVLNAPLGDNCEHAGWRELFAFISQLKIDIEGFHIIAAASRYSFIDDPTSPSFPVASVNIDKILITASGVRNPDDDTDKAYSKRHFYLVRVYE